MRDAVRRTQAVQAGQKILRDVATIDNQQYQEMIIKTAHAVRSSIPVLRTNNPPLPVRAQHVRHHPKLIRCYAA